MSRIAGDPQSILAVTTKLLAGHDLELLAAADLRRAPIPELPAHLAFVVPSVLTEQAGRLERDARLIEAIARELARRALVLIAAGATSGESRALRALGSMFGSGLRVRAEYRLLQLLRSGSLYQSEVIPIVRAAGPASRAATEAWLFWQSILPEYAVANRFTVGANLTDLAAYRQAGFGSVSGLGRLTGRVFGPLGVASSAWTMVHGSPYKGCEGDVDRWVVAPAGLGAAGVVTAAALGVFVAPELLIAAGVIGVGIAGWTIWNERRAIGHALVTGGKWVADGAAAAWHASVPGVIVDNRREIAHALVTGADAGMDGVERAVGYMGSKAKDLGGGALHAGGDALHGTESALGDAADGLKKLGGVFG